jgi:hypothetical protein
MSDLGVVSYESFFSLIDIDIDKTTRELSVEYNKGYAQIFRADSSEIDTIFFMASVTSESSSKLNIDVVTLSDPSGSIFIPTTTNTPLVGGGLFQTITAEDCNQVNINSEEEQEEGSFWYSFPANLSLTEGNYYAVVFSNTNSATTNLPKIYFTEDYRSDVFPQVLASTDGDTPNWDNSLFEKGSKSSSTGGRVGSICVGYLGNIVGEGASSFDAGEITMGGSDARRGYPVYLYVKKTTNNVSVKFSQSSPVTGEPEETNRASMQWYWYLEGTLPISNNANLLKSTRTNVRLETGSYFALFVQPDKFAPYPKIYFPETELTLQSSTVGVVEIQQGYVSHKIQEEDGNISDNSDNFSLENWAHFAEKRNAVYDTDRRAPEHSTNPSFLDFSLEKKGEDIEEPVAENIKDLRNDYYQVGIRGFDNIVKFRGRYLAFPRFSSFNSVKDANISIPLLTTDDPSSNNWDSSTYSMTFGLGEDEYFIGVYDAIVRNTSNGETLFLLLQINPGDVTQRESTQTFFNLYYVNTYTNPLSTIYDAALAYSENKYYYDGFFTTEEFNNLVIDGNITNATIDQVWINFLGGSASDDFLGSGNVLTVNTASSASIGQFIHATSGKDYRVKFEIGSLTTPVVVSLGGYEYSVSTSGSYHIVMSPYDNYGKLEFAFSSGNMSATLDNISVEEVGELDLSTNVVVNPDVKYDDSSWEMTKWVRDPASNTFLLAAGAPSYTGNKLYQVLNLDVGKKYNLYIRPYFDNNTESCPMNGDDYITVSVAGVSFGNLYLSDLLNPYFSDLLIPYEFIAVDKTPLEIVAGGVTLGDIKIASIIICERKQYFDVDKKWVKFLPSPDDRYLLYTAANHSYIYGEETTTPSSNSVEAHGGKFGLWKLDLMSDLDLISEANPVPKVLDERGFNHKINREPEISCCFEDDGTVYFGTCVEGESSSILDYGYGYGVTDIDYSVLLGTSFIDGRLGEIYSMKEIGKLKSIVTGNRNQEWLVGYADDSVAGYGDLIYGVDDIYSVHYNRKYGNSRVSFMTKVDDIIHAWLSPIFAGKGNPFHVATDIKTNKIKVLRRFPILNNNNTGGPGEDGLPPLLSPIVSNLNLMTVSKAIDYISNGVVTDDKIYICGYGGDCIVNSIFWFTITPTSTNDTVVGATYTNNGKTFTVIETLSKTTGTILKTSGTGSPSIAPGTLTYASGTGDATIAYSSVESFIGHTGKNQTSIYYSPKWLIYDTKTINDAYKYYNDTSYKIYTTSELTDTALTLSHNLIQPVYAEISSGSNKFGVYNGSTLSKYYFSENMYEYYNYPAFRATKTNHRVGTYCGSVANLYESNTLAGTKYIGGNERDTNPQLVSQAGVTFLICDNPLSGFHVYKTYGLKQNPEHWGVIVDESLLVSTKWQNTNLEADVENDILIKSYGGNEAYKDIAKRVKISVVDGFSFISSMKSDNEFDNDTIEEINVDSFRYITRLTPGVKKIQNFSFYYQFNYLRAPYDVNEVKTDNGSDIPITTYIIDTMKDTGYMNLVVKHASSLEKLYTKPTEEIVIQLAYDTKTEPDIEGRYFCHHTFQTDVSDIFFRMESRDLITPYDRGNGVDYDFTWKESTFSLDSNNDYTPYDGSKDPYAEILVKGLTFSNVDISPVDEDTKTIIKSVAINGIIKSTNKQPKEFIGDGVEVSSNDEIVIDFPSSIYVSEISFLVSVGAYSGQDSNSSFELAYLSQSTINKHNYNIVSETDWISAGSVGFDPDDYSDSELQEGIEVKLDSLQLFMKSLRIYVKTGISFTIKDFTVKSFASASGSTFAKGGGVKNQDMIIIDDTHGLITGKNSDNTDVASYSEFKNEDSYVTVDLGTSGVPINRITMNVVGGLSRSMKVHLWKYGESTYDSDPIYDDVIQDYMYSIVRWDSRLNSTSDKVDVEILHDDSLTDSGLDTDGHAAAFNSVIGVGTNYSQHFSNGALRNYIFRPNARKSRNLTIINSETYNGSPYNGTISVPSQMDENGPFGSDQGEKGVIERSVLIEFPVANIRKVKITVYGFEENNMEPIRINGFKVYSPLVDSNGVAVWPSASTSWNIVLRANSTTSL